MPLLRMGLYSQNVELYLAPTADGRDTWLGVMQTIACEGRCFVVTANQCLKRKDLPTWINGIKTVGNAGQSDNGEKQFENKQRRKSIRRKTEEGHEIILPDPALNDNTAPASKGNFTRHSNQTSANGSESVEQEKQHGKALDNSLYQPPSAHHGDVGSLTADNNNKEGEFVSRGGSCIIGPTGEVLAGPLWEMDEGGILTAVVDFEDCERGRLELDVAGSYGRLDSFELNIKGLDLNPPP